MTTIPAGGPFLVRTHVTQDGAWRSLCTQVSAETGEGFRANLRLVDDPALDGATLDVLVAAIPADDQLGFLAVADQVTFTSSGQPVLVVELLGGGRYGRAFRAAPAAMQEVENNLSLSNLDFDDFLSSLDPAGVFHGFGPPSPPAPARPADAPTTDAHAEMNISCDDMRIHRLMWDYVDSGLSLRHQAVDPALPFPGLLEPKEVATDEPFEISCPRCGLRETFTARELEPSLRRFHRLVRDNGQETSAWPVSLASIATGVHGPPSRHPDS